MERNTSIYKERKVISVKTSFIYFPEKEGSKRSLHIWVYEPEEER